MTRCDVDAALFLFAVQLHEPRAVLDWLCEEVIEKNKAITSQVMALVFAKSAAKQSDDFDEAKRIGAKIKELTGCK